MADASEQGGSFLDVFDFGDEDTREGGAAGGGEETAPDKVAGSGAARRAKKKAEARRAKKERELVQLEARMSEARLQAGPAKGDEETKKLREQLSTLGLEIREVAADGHCMFRAVACQLPATTADRKGEDEAVWSLRQQVANHLLAHEGEFAPFFEPTDTAKDFRSYCEEMRSSAAWGSQLELRALAQARGICIRVHSADAPVVVMNESVASAPIDIVFHRHAFGLGEHFNAALPRE